MRSGSSTRTSENRVEERTSQLEATIAELESHQQEDLRQSEEMLPYSWSEGVSDYAIFMLGPDGRVVSWNEGAERIQGYEASEVIGEHFSIFYAPEDVERGLPGEELRVAAVEGRFEEEGLRVRKDGTGLLSRRRRYNGPQGRGGQPQGLLPGDAGRHRPQRGRGWRCAASLRNDGWT